MNALDHDKIISALGNVITTTTALIAAGHDYETALDAARDLKTTTAATNLDAARTAYHHASRAYSAALATYEGN